MSKANELKKIAEEIDGLMQRLGAHTGELIGLGDEPEWKRQLADRLDEAKSHLNEGRRIIVQEADRIAKGTHKPLGMRAPTEEEIRKAEQGQIPWGA